MARKIGIMGVGQRTGQPRTYVKKSVAQLLIRRNLAEWVMANLVIRMRKELSPIKAIFLTGFTPKPFIPEHLPSSIDKRIGVIVKVPALPNQIRFRAIRAEL
jgi:hypothetical protein